MKKEKMNHIMDSITANCFRKEFTNPEYSSDQIESYINEPVVVTKETLGDFIDKRNTRYLDLAYKDYIQEVKPFTIKVPRKELGYLAARLINRSEFSVYFNNCIEHGLTSWNQIRAVVMDEFPMLKLAIITRKIQNERLIETLYGVLQSAKKKTDYLSVKSIDDIMAISKMIKEDGLRLSFVAQLISVTGYSKSPSQMYPDVHDLVICGYDFQHIEEYLKLSEFYTKDDFIEKFKPNTDIRYIKLDRYLQMLVRKADRNTGLYNCFDYSIETIDAIIKAVETYFELSGVEYNEYIYFTHRDFYRCIPTKFSSEKIIELLKIYEFDYDTGSLIEELISNNTGIDSLKYIATQSSNDKFTIKRYLQLLDSFEKEDFRALIVFGLKCPDSSIYSEFPDKFNAEKFIKWYNEKGEMKNV